MKTLDEVIKAFDNWMPDCDSCVFYCDIYGENNCTMADALYYLKAHKEMVDGIVNVICQYKETFKMIIEDCENENAR